jgi:hypothetical protein
MCAFAVGANQPSQRDSEPPRDSPTDQAAAPSPLAEVASRGAPNKAYSPIVLGGLVRLIEFLLLAGVGSRCMRCMWRPCGDTTWPMRSLSPACRCSR